MSRDVVRPRVAAVGAYERDNFGDLLYLKLMQIHAGANLDLSFVAPIRGEMTHILGHAVPTAAPLLASGDYDAIWTVGGEVASATLEYAYRTDLGDDAYQALMRLAPHARRTELRRATDGVLYDSPYIPRPSAHGNPQATLVLNSVGVAGVLNARGARRLALESVLREATYISVRDVGSHRALTSLGIKHNLAPDLAHTLPLVRTVEPSSPPYALVHMPEFAVREHGMEAWVRALRSTASLGTFEIRLFLAGTAPGHDTLKTAEQVRDNLVSATGWHVEVSQARGVWDRVDEIASAGLWIGGSLHGRIVAEAYGVPRLSIGSWKVDQYAQSWDAEFPAGVTPKTLESAVSFALAHEAAADNSLAARALQSLESLVEMVIRRWEAPTPLEDTARLLTVRAAEAEALHALVADYERVETDERDATVERLATRVSHFEDDRNRWREEARRLREDRDLWQTKFERLREDRDRWQVEASNLRVDRDRWREMAESPGLGE